MRVVNKAKEPKPIIGGLQLLADFLNAIGPNTTETQWQTYLKMMERHPRGGIFFDWTTDMKIRDTKLVPDVNLKEAKEVQLLINNDLSFLKENKGIKNPFDQLIFNLNSLNLKTGWQCVPLDGSKPPPGQAILTINWADGSKGRWTAQSWPITTTLRDSLYAILGGALVSGTLNRLKVCRECGRYIVVTDLKRCFCSDKNCKDVFYNRDKVKKGIFKKRREQKKQADMDNAIKLIRKGAPYKEVQDKTGLPKRDIERLFESQEDECE